MSTRALKNQAATRSVPKAEPKAVRTRMDQVPSTQTVARRLAALTAADMPWLRKDVDLTPPDGGPEVAGPPDGLSPRKEQINIRIDADVLRWFKAAGDGYQTRINDVLRSFMESGSRTTR